MVLHLCQLLIEIAILVPVVHLAPARRETVRIHAAFYLDGNLHLFNNQSEVLILRKGRKPVEAEPVSLFHLPEDYRLTAAVAAQTFFGREFYFFGEGDVFYTLAEEKLTARRYRSHLPRHLWCGLDAAVSDGMTIYYFKGCDYFRQSLQGQWDDDPKPLSSLGLPCHVDAAWNDGKNILALRGDQVWVKGRDVNDPSPFGRYFQQNVWRLDRNADDGLFNDRERYPIVITRGNQVIHRTRVMSRAEEECELVDEKGEEEEEEPASAEEETGDAEEEEGQQEEVGNEAPSEKEEEETAEP